MEKQKKKRVMNILSNIVMAIMVFILSLLLIRNTCYTAIVVSGLSMSPTLADKEYGYAIKTKYAINHIERFDIVVFELANDEGRDLIKRVIGLPGDKITFKGENCDLYVNDEYVAQDFISIEYQKQTCEGMVQSYQKDQPIILDDNSYLVLGDNRGNSKDSLHGIGMVKKEQLIGVLSFTYADCEQIVSDNGRIVCKGKKHHTIKYF